MGHFTFYVDILHAMLMLGGGGVGFLISPSNFEMVSFFCHCLVSPWVICKV